MNIKLKDTDIRHIIMRILTWGIGGVLIISGIILTFLKFLTDVKITYPWCVVLISILIGSGCIIYLVDNFINHYYKKQIIKENKNEKRIK